jgi:hypothetical protein
VRCETEEPDAQGRVESEVVERAVPRQPMRPVFVVVAICAVAVVFAVGVALSGSLSGVMPHEARQAIVSAAPSSAAAAAPAARDSGAREFATGRATVLAPGRYRYAVESGDTFLGIASRFHVCTYDLVVGRPPAEQSAVLTPGTRLTVELGAWPTKPDGTIDCVWDD